jgi:hypothetical protein
MYDYLALDTPRGGLDVFLTHIRRCLLVEKAVHGAHHKGHKGTLLSTPITITHVSRRSKSPVKQHRRQGMDRKVRNSNIDTNKHLDRLSQEASTSHT